MKKISLCFALLLVIVPATLVMAGPYERGQGMMGTGWEVGRQALSSLNLTAEQTEKIKALRESGQKEVAPLRVKLFTKRAELRLLWMQTNLEGDKIKAKQKEVLVLKGQILDKVTDIRLDFNKILTPEQRTQLLALIIGKAHHGPRWGKAGRKGPKIGGGPRK